MPLFMVGRCQGVTQRCNGCARGGEGTLYNGLYGEAPPERGTFSVIINIIITIIPRALMGSESIATFSNEDENADEYWYDRLGPSEWPIQGGSAGFLAAKKD